MLTKSFAGVGKSYIEKEETNRLLLFKFSSWSRFAGAAGVISGVDCLFPAAERDAVGLLRKILAGRRMECLRVDIADVGLLAAAGRHLTGTVRNRGVQFLARCRLGSLPSERFAVRAAGDVAL